ncbi:hypothetical protein RDI58_020429 [Solanum bulbocastanum]
MILNTRRCDGKL